MIKKLDVVAAIIERDGKILLAQRPAHADQAGLWEFAGGKVEPGETQPQALIRELREELGLTPRPASISPAINATCLADEFICTPGMCLRLTV